ncbi:MAG: DUF2953 domain-containing protein [Acutalibacteraceae bacterium]
MTALYIILGILLLLVILLLCNVKILIKYDGELSVKIKYFITYDATKSEDQKPKKKKSKKKSTSDKPKKEPKKSSWQQIKEEKGLSGLINILKSLANTTLNASKKLLNRLIVKDLRISVVIASDNAADTAINYGRACAAIYPVSAALISRLNTKKYDVSVRPDFDAKQTKIDCFAYLKIRLIFVTAFALRMLFGYIRTMAKASADSQA